MQHIFSRTRGSCLKGASLLQLRAKARMRLSRASPCARSCPAHLAVPWCLENPSTTFPRP
eukprot:12509297-Alexandrium_andersonii.AAC.1